MSASSASAASAGGCAASGAEERDSPASKKNKLFHSFVDAVASSEAENLSRVSALHEELRLENTRVQERRARLDSLMKVMHDYADSKRQIDGRKGRNVLQLSLGGEHADVKASTLAGNGGYPNMLSRILTSGRYDAIFLRDRDGRIFLDFESGWVEPLIDYLRILSVSTPGAAFPIPKVRPVHQQGFDLVMELFKVIDFGMSSTIPMLQDTAKVRQVKSWLAPSLGQSSSDQVELTLLYRKTRDGATAADFHRLCDNATNTVTFIHPLAGDVCGGYSNLPWANTGYLHSTSAFIFNLSRGLHYGAQHPQHAMYVSPNCGPSFGSGHDLHLAADMSSGSCLQTAYTGLAGPAQFTAVEVEVYEVTTRQVPAASDEEHSEPDAAASASVFLTPFLQELAPVPDSASLPFVSRMKALVGSLDALPPRAVELTNHLIEARARIAVEEAELLDEILIATHLFLKPLGELDAALAAVRTDQGSAVGDAEGGEGGEGREESVAAATDMCMCDKIEAAYHEMRTLLEARLACPAPDRVDELLYYNVGGKKVAIRRATLLCSLPDSALAIAAGSAWKEQQDDLLDGYIFIDHPKAAFLSILAFARLQALVAGKGGTGAVIRIEREEEASLNHLLEYFRVDASYTLSP